MEIYVAKPDYRYSFKTFRACSRGQNDGETDLTFLSFFFLFSFYLGSPMPYFADAVFCTGKNAHFYLSIACALFPWTHRLSIQFSSLFRLPLHPLFRSSKAHRCSLTPASLTCQTPVQRPVIS